jgi:hypothetical protein
VNEEASMESSIDDIEWCVELVVGIRCVELVVGSRSEPTLMCECRVHCPSRRPSTSQNVCDVSGVSMKESQ